VITARKILAGVGEPSLKLYPGNGYWYWVFDTTDFYDTLSVPVMRLGNLPLAEWIADGKRYAAEMHAKRSEALARAADPATRKFIKVRKDD
jgi:hypothetical protein